MKHIPNIFTLLNLFFGCLAIVYSLQLNVSFFYEVNGEPILESMQSSLWMGSLFIGIAAVIDFFDGFIARMLNASSKLGKELDSLSDIVSFGVAPAVILYQILRLALMRQEDGADESVIWNFPAFILACCAAYRLAKFNLDDSQQYYFKGVPSPASALVVASLPLILYYNYFEGSVNDLLLNKWVLYLIIFLLSYLMVSNIPFLSLKFQNKTLKGNLPLIIMVILSVVLIMVLKWLAVPIIFLLYIIISVTTIRKTEIK
ncbi:MAG TPA: CDP-diacylglycerol--serine O-phosphatidyltransferase [Chitinophagaceae bacterium]|nr:CDP-diacylglycerol--serine O-phosphatidyltransferase [Chitinophagaceae bacterium]